ncbi:MULTISPECIES: APC family permease [Pseudomonas]|uniref:APC family permease n=1 Tax=Pseudomonas sp. Hg7Tf TaxID=3236988 RepID=A0AB39I5B1_9PSED|nr:MULTISPECIES: APC family permease [Pseudomonas]KJK07468.1 amino acid transporter [Pseudomonas sp. 5]MDD1977481.1 APC family permease [Pseudomonas putida]MDH2561742.1 APC family permease [Pseudomonas sp. Hg5Tf]
MSSNASVSTGALAPPASSKKLGLTALLAVAIGLVVSQGVMVLMLQGVGIAGPGFIVPLALAWLLALSYACSFSELALMIPRAGSLSSYTEVAIGQFPAILATFSGYVVVAMFALSAELLLMEFIIDKVYPHSMPPLTVALGVLALFTVLNLFNIDIFARLQTVLAVVMVVVLLVMGLSAMNSDIASPNPGLFDIGSWNPLGLGVIALTAMAVWGFVGAEFVCPLVEETRRPQRNIPGSMMIGLTVIFVIIALYCLGALLTVPQAELASNGLPHYLFATTVFGEAGQVFLVTAAITATCSTLNSSLAAIPRMLLGMARNGQAFGVLKRQGKRTGAPWVAVLFVSAITGLPLLLMHDHPDAINQLLLAAALAWLLAYIITHINVIALRRRYPQAARPFRTPFYPLPQLFGIAGMLFAIWHVSPSPEMTFAIFAYAGLVLLVVSIIAVLWIKCVMRKPLFKPEPLASVLGTSTDKKPQGDSQ